MNFCYQLGDSITDPGLTKMGEISHHEQDYKLFDPSLSDIYSSQLLNQTTNDSTLVQQIKDEDICQNYFLSGEKFEVKSKVSTSNSLSTLSVENNSDVTPEANQAAQKFVTHGWVNKSDQPKYECPKKCSEENRRSDDNTHIKRPMNAFMVWSQSERKVIASEYPKMHNSDISKILGTRWKALTTEQKKPYIKMAKQLQHKHNLEHPNYKYKPRRKLKRNAKNIQLAQFPVSTAVTNQIEKYLNGFNIPFDNNNLNNLRRYQNDSFSAKSLIFPDVSNPNKIPSLEPPNSHPVQGTYIECPPLKLPNFRPSSVNNLSFPSSCTAFGFAPNIDNYYSQTATVTSLDSQNHFSFVPFVPMLNQQFPVFNQQLMALSNSDSTRDHAVLQGSVLGVAVPEKKFKESDFSNSDYLKHEAELEQPGNGVVLSDECTSYGLSSLNFPTHPLFSHPCIEDPMKNISSCYQMGLINIQDLTQYSSFNPPPPNEINN